MKTIYLLALVMTVAACKPRNEYSPEAPLNITFSAPVLVDLPADTSYAEKRKFIDITCDGIEDMIEVRDTKVWGQDYQAVVFPGENNSAGYLQFSNEKKFTFKLPLEKSWLSNMLKIDAADVNGDGCGDLVFSEYKKSFKHEQYIVKIALNQGDGKKFKLASELITDEIPLEEAILNVLHNVGGDEENLNNYFAMDWSDANGDGRDDLHLFWKDRKSVV